MSEEHNGSPYFPPLYGSVDCGQCEATECWCWGKYQRSRRDFTHTSGRCPWLPDKRGFVEEKERKLYAETFPLVCAERSDGVLYLTLTVPGSKRSKKAYLAKGAFLLYMALQGRIWDAEWRPFFHFQEKGEDILVKRDRIDCKN